MNDRRNEATNERTNYTQSKTTLKYSLLTWLLMLQWYILVRNDTCQKNQTRTLLELETGTFY